MAVSGVMSTSCWCLCPCASGFTSYNVVYLGHDSPQKENLYCTWMSDARSSLFSHRGPPPPPGGPPPHRPHALVSWRSCCCCAQEWCLSCPCPASCSPPSGGCPLRLGHLRAVCASALCSHTHAHSHTHTHTTRPTPSLTHCILCPHPCVGLQLLLALARGACPRPCCCDCLNWRRSLPSSLFSHFCAPAPM
jgi:hypothetical protein